MGIDKAHDYFTIVLGSAVKFIFGPIYGIVNNDISLVEAALFTFIGMMCSVIIVSFLGQELRIKIQKRFQANKSGISKRKRRAIKIWNSWGLRGVAFMTPLILTPIGGTIIAIGFGEKRMRIISAMVVSGLIWSITLTSLVYLFKDLALQIFT